jgi:hypothetical protein
MDVVWDQDVRTALSAIIGREPVENQMTDDKVKGHIQLAIRYANELSSARAVIERRPPVSHFRPGRTR